MERTLPSGSTPHPEAEHPRSPFLIHSKAQEYMIEVINSLLAVPGALLALDDILRRLYKVDANVLPRAELVGLEQQINEVRRNLQRFAEFGPAMKAWKDAHHVTSLVLSECEDAFRLVDKGRNYFASANETQWRKIRSEINTMRRANVGSITYLHGHHDPAIFEYVTAPVEYCSAPRWDEYIVGLEQSARNCLDGGQRGDLYDVLVELRNYVIALNHRADQHLKEGIGELTNKIIEFRGALAPQVPE
jgi:hypothetical protein